MSIAEGAAATTDDQEGAAAPPKSERIYRHAATTRATHWINLVCVTVLLLSGLQIFNAHPRLYWGQYGANSDQALIAMEATQDRQGRLVGITTIGPARLATTGLLGASVQDGHLVPRAFPVWLTLPSTRDLATGRNLHFFFAWILAINGLAYLVFAYFSGHLRRDLYLRPEEKHLRHLLADVWAHVKLHVPRGEESKRYNTLQKIAYLSVIFGLLPLMVLTGMTMSPGMDAAFPFLLDVFGGRQSARTIHFIVAWSLVLFAAVHLFEIFLVGAFNEIRAMITGWYEVKPEKKA
ncbi:MAG: cytochrome b/b6 domain-containing protein [Proteobacteria bacterium]|nr:cytochrome b/b6 domain-containing protein [Pseudomonadota bacterium]